MVDMRRVILSIMLVLATLAVQSQTFYELTFTLPNSNSKFVGLLIYTDDEHCKMRLVDDEALAEDYLARCDYLDAENAFARGDWIAARELYAAAGSWEDSADKVRLCDYRRAEDLLSSGGAVF